MKTLTIRKPSWLKKSTRPSHTLSLQEKLSAAVGSHFQVKQAFRVGNHCWVELATPLPPIGKFGYFFLDHVSVAIEEMRGVWLTTTDSRVLLEEDQLRPALEKLKALNFNTLYPAVWTGGYTLYPSRLAMTMFGHAIHPRMHSRGGDMLAEILEVGHELGFRVLPWFEYGLMTTPPPGPLAVQKNQWLTQDMRGELIRLKASDKGGTVPDDCVWLNPCRPEVKAFLVALIAEVVRHYPVDGIQLDDHFGMPKEMGYDPFTKDLFLKETKQRHLPKNRHELEWKRWSDWRIKHVTDLMRQIFKAVKIINPNCRLSLSPNPHGFSTQEYLANWGIWEQEGLIEELAIQLYRPTLSALNAELKEKTLLRARDRIPTAIGLFTGYRSAPWAASVIREQTQLVRSKNFAGVAYFFYETLINQQIGPTLGSTIARSRTDLDFLA